MSIWCVPPAVAARDRQVGDIFWPVRFSSTAVGVDPAGTVDVEADQQTLGSREFAAGRRHRRRVGRDRLELARRARASSTRGVLMAACGAVRSGIVILRIS